METAIFCSLKTYGCGYDLLCMGSWPFLHAEMELPKAKGMYTKIIDFPQMDRKEAISAKPKSIEKPIDYEQSKEAIGHLENYRKSFSK